MTARGGPARALLVTVVACLGVAVLAGGALSGCGRDDGPAPAGSRTLRVGAFEVHAVVRGPEAADAPLTVLFLHGASYTSRVWADRGILDAVAAEGYRAVAVDLPAHGDTPDLPGAEIAPAGFLALLVGALAPPGRVVVVSPSMSGRYGLALLAERPDVDLAGFVAVAPVGIDGFERPADAPALPALLVWGEHDDVIPRQQAEQLRSLLPGSRLEVIAGGSHAPYDDEPATFDRVLLVFLASIAR